MKIYDLENLPKTADEFLFSTLEDKDVIKGKLSIDDRGYPISLFDGKEYYRHRIDQIYHLDEAEDATFELEFNQFEKCVFKIDFNFGENYDASYHLKTIHSDYDPYSFDHTPNSDLETSADFVNLILQTYGKYEIPLKKNDDDIQVLSIKFDYGTMEEGIIIEGILYFDDGTSQDDTFNYHTFQFVQLPKTDKRIMLLHRIWNDRNGYLRTQFLTPVCVYSDIGINDNDILTKVFEQSISILNPDDKK